MGVHSKLPTGLITILPQSDFLPKQILFNVLSLLISLQSMTSLTNSATPLPLPLSYLSSHGSALIGSSYPAAVVHVPPLCWPGSCISLQMFQLLLTGHSPPPDRFRQFLDLNVLPILMTILINIGTYFSSLSILLPIDFLLSIAFSSFTWFPFPSILELDAEIVHNCLDLIPPSQFKALHISHASLFFQKLIPKVFLWSLSFKGSPCNGQTHVTHLQN